MEPLIFTSKGNLPVASLEERVVWAISPDEIVCNVEHWLGDECVRRQCNVNKLKGMETIGQITNLA